MKYYEPIKTHTAYHPSTTPILKHIRYRGKDCEKDTKEKGKVET